MGGAVRSSGYCVDSQPDGRLGGSCPQRDTAHPKCGVGRTAGAAGADPAVGGGVRRNAHWLGRTGGGAVTCLADPAGSASKESFGFRLHPGKTGADKKERDGAESGTDSGKEAEEKGQSPKEGEKVRKSHQEAGYLQAKGG